MKHAVVVGAGVGGLTSAAVLAQAGWQVDVLEAHVYPGGTAGTFYHKGYRFDAGATLAGGFAAGGPMDRVRARLGLPPWPGELAPVPMRVHLPDGLIVDRYADQGRWSARRAAFGRASLSFWRWQERTAESMWHLAEQNPPWPPAGAGDLWRLLVAGGRWMRAGGAAGLGPGALLDAFMPLARRLPQDAPRLRLFIDAQLLIAAQATAAETVALYGAAALDLPRRGVLHLEDGMISIARHLETALQTAGGEVHYRQRVRSIALDGAGKANVATERGEVYVADVVIANLPPANVAELIEAPLPAPLKGVQGPPEDGWGAFTLHLGVREDAVAGTSVLHHQIIAGRPLSEGGSLFLSVSPPWDSSRAPAGRRAVTISTHTRLDPWWHLFENDRRAYERRKSQYCERLLRAASRVFPGLAQAAELVLPGSPVTFRRFTGRSQGWVGGFPQTSLLRAWPARLAPNLYLVGDSIFPGQSTAAVALGGLRVGDAIAAEH